MYLFLMVFPLNYELREREENNLSVKFKLLINKTEMFEAELPCLGKKKSYYTTHLRIINQSTYTIPEVTNWSIAPAVDTVLHILPRAITEPKHDRLLGSPRPSCVGQNVSLPLATISLAFDFKRQDGPNISVLAYNLAELG